MGPVRFLVGKGRTSLHLAVLSDRIDLIERFISLKDKPDVYGLTPLDLAKLLGKEDALRAFGVVQETSFYKRPDIAIQGTPCDDIDYLSHPVFESASILEAILAKTAKAKHAITEKKIWMGVYFDKEIRQGLHPPISIREVPGIGSGVFAEKRIPPCGYLGEYTGVLQERKSKQLKGKYYCVRYTVWDMGRKNFVLDAEKRGNFTRFINHSEKPNVALQSVLLRGLPRMIFVALEEILPGTQITFDYGTLFWKECVYSNKSI